jgi:hypothetical protein
MATCLPLLPAQVTIPSTPTHLDRVPSQAHIANATHATVADLLILAHASCLVASDSGFSIIAK